MTVGRMSQRGQALAARVTRVLDTPVLEFCDLPLISFAVGQPAGWTWPAVTPPKGTQYPYQDALRHGFVYFGRRADGLTKVGFSAEVVDRVIVSNLEPLLIVGIVQLAHERALHAFFSEERVSREVFTGPRLELFLQLARARTVARVRHYQLRGYRISRAEDWRRHTLAGRAA